MIDAIASRLSPALADRYTLERELGAGGMANVYLARDLKHRRQVAIKVLREELSASLGKDRFLREIQVAAALQHPHIVPLYDSGEAAGLLFYVMPFVDGLSVRERLVKEGELPVHDAVRILRDVADALTEAHRHGVVHRDLKPENVMLRGRHALVTDFGVAKALSEATGRPSLTTVGVALGTPTYMAPEQAVADPHVDHRADIYAFGVLAYELLTGQPPFAGTSPQQILAAHVTATAVPITTKRSMAPQLAALVMRCLEKKPADRWQSAEELISQLEAVLTPSGGITPMATVPIQTVAPSKTRRSLRTIVIAAALIGAVGLAWVLNRGGGAANGDAADLRQIAVLPFENIGGDTANVYFADGMTDELANALSKVPGLQVASRTSSYAFRNAQTRDIAAIREALGVGALLEGTVSRAGDRLRVSARLTNASTGLEIWSEAFVRNANDVFAVQDEVARAIAQALAPALAAGVKTVASADTSRGTQDLVAYDLYLRGRHLWYQRGVEPLRQAVAMFEQAAARDPNFAQAWSGIALAQVTLSDYEGSASPERIAEIEQAAARATALNPSLAEPHFALGYMLARTSRWAEAEPAFRRAVARDPRSPTAHQWYGLFLTSSRRDEEALQELRLASELDPLSAIIASNYASALASTGNLDEAMRVGERSIALDSTNALVRLNLATTVLLPAQQFERASQELDAGSRLGGPPAMVLGMRMIVAFERGDSAGARASLRQLETATEGEGPSIGLAGALAALGERDRALTALEAVVASTGWGAPHPDALEANPRWAPFRTDPRFRRIIERLRAAR
ncbi:MAG: protein kinase [Gemmatimonadota bacterium]|nr:protein kinase [Gemmatimonadota bacterium]